tara:strand:- start:574 stop:1119 length:546 start_codon:yes stop_codon:yes gene_type:complete
VKVSKEIISEIPRRYFFVTAKININSKLLIQQIEKGINEESNRNYKTNVIAKMTSWKYFLNNKDFLDPLLHVMNMYDDLAIKHKGLRRNYSLDSAWGYKESTSEYTLRHDHVPAIISGALFLSDHPQKLYFHEIDQTVDCFEGSLCLFSSFLEHNSLPWRNVHAQPRYGISFNFIQRNEEV